MRHNKDFDKPPQLKVVELDIETYLSSTEYDPSPHRVDPTEKPVSERKRLPIVYTCENCTYQISFSLENFKNHVKSDFSNLAPDKKQLITEYLKDKNQKSTIDFNCPKCKQPTTILYDGGPSGYWGEYFFRIYKILVIK